MDGWSAVRFAPLFSGVPPEDYVRICAAARVQGFVRHKTLYLEGDAVEQVFLLKSGFVKTTKLGPRGAEVILRVGVPGDVLGAISLYSTGRHTTTARALRVGYALVWEARVFFVGIGSARYFRYFEIAKFQKVNPEQARGEPAKGTPSSPAEAPATPVIDIERFPFDTRTLMQVVVTLMLLPVTLFIVISKRFGPKDKHWAYGTAGLIIGFWLKP